MNYDPFYRCGHYDGKGRVLEFIKAQKSDTSSENGMVWSSITTGPYMEMLKIVRSTSDTYYHYFLKKLTLLLLI